MQRLSFLPFQGAVDLSIPDNTFYLMEDYGIDHNHASDEPERVFFCCLVSLSCYSNCLLINNSGVTWTTQLVTSIFREE